MGREIRRVPPNWEHPRGKWGHYHPMYDQDFETAAAERAGWGEEPLTDADAPYYRPAWTEEETTAYQVYEDVTEGTPVSPVFETEKAMREWLIAQGHTVTAVAEFLRLKWCPSFMMSAEKGISPIGIDSLDR